MDNVFSKLYDGDVIEEDGAELAGKDKLLAAAGQFLSWLKEAEEEEEEEDPEVAKALKGIVRPNNASKLR